jgi:hypothetical protein
MKEAWNKLLPRDLKYLNQNMGENMTPGAQCDMFYIPQRFRMDVLRLNNYFQNVFCELAVPTFICCLDLMSNWDPTTLYWNYGVGRTWPMQFTCVHPVKFSNAQNRLQVQRLFDQMIK